MTRFLLAAGLGLAVGLLLAFPDPAPAEPLAPAAAARDFAAEFQPAPAPQEELVEKVRKSIDRGVRYLEKQQNPQGNWEGIVLNILAGLDGGATSLVTLALLNCGVKPEERSVSRALDYLRTLPPKKTYVVALQTMVFAEARQAKDLPRIQENANWLVNTAIGYQNGQGQLEGWSYPAAQIADNSNTQYALLGLYAAKQAGAKIDPRIWKEIQRYYARHMRDETTNPNVPATAGYWMYHNLDNRPSHTMTVAGVCGLIIAGMGMDVSEQKLDDATGVAAGCGVYSADSEVAKGMNWVGRHFNFEVVGKGLGKSDLYNYYGLERLGRLSGQRFIGTHDWYREGCEYLIRNQALMNDGSFSDQGLVGAGPLATSFALLFLSKGRTPILVSKFAWGEAQNDTTGFIEVPRKGDPPGMVNWNRKHSDARHVVEFASRELFKGAPLAWQVFDPRRRSFDPEPAKGLSTDDKIREEVAILLQSPVLYLNGHGALNFAGLAKEPLTIPEQIIQRYIQEGGFLIAEACCGDQQFAASFLRMMKRIFPENDFRPLPNEHAIWSMMPGVVPKDFPDLQGLERGCRTVAVFSPSPLAGYWEEQRFMPADGRNPKSRGEKAFCLSRNVIAYATGLEMPKPRLTIPKLRDANEKGTAPTKSAFQPAQLRIGESEPAPAAMRNLMLYVRDTAHLEVNPAPKFLPPYDTNLFAFKFMYLHGRRPLTLNDQEIANVKSNLQTGGLLFADAACNGFEAWKAFDRSFRDTCAKLFPDHKLEPIPPDDPIFTTRKAEDGSKVVLTSVLCRREKADGSGPEPERKPYAPLLEGVKHDGRWVIVYSKYDVGCALEGHKAGDCMGHDKESALKLSAGVVLYALKR
jgi:hypothetical protein